jgi:hypothetical protein
MKKFILLLLLICVVLKAQVVVSGEGGVSTYTITNNDDDKSLGAIGTTIIVTNPYYYYSSPDDQDATPSVGDRPVATIGNTAATTITDMVLLTSGSKALILLEFITDNTTIQHGGSGTIYCGGVDLSFQTGDLAFAYYNGTDWYIWPIFLRD